jgi:DnaJ-class molecular chaperone
MPAMKKTCDYCGGSGQIQFFAGVSRFFLSCEECPHCAGIGHELPPDDTIT